MKKTVFYIAIAAFCILALLAWAFMGGADRETLGKGLTAAVLLMILFCAVRRSPEHAAAGHRSFGKITTEVASSSITFSDVAANEEALQSLRELADYLRTPEKYLRMGARMPRGVLLYGPPGTGKTLLARALAGEAGVPFYSLSGSDFVQMYVGVGASRVRDLFAKARKAEKCVVFIDEIDAMGKKRSDSSSEERDQTLNALLSEMSGFKETDGVIVLAATNRLDTLDPALIRPGRFDRHIEVGLPGKEERLDILKLHCRNKPLSPEVSLDDLALNTVHFSGASLESLVNEAAILAVRRGAEQIAQRDLDAAYIIAVAGKDRTPTASRQELAVVALHEAGHAIASLCLMPENRLNRVSILPSSRGAAGYNLSVPVEHTVLERRQLCAQIQVLLAGRAAEMLMNNEDGVTSGASNDLARAAELATAMVMDLGMTEETAVSLRALQKSCQSNSPDGLSRSRTLLTEQLQKVHALLESHMEDLLLLTETLIDRESLTESDLAELLPHLTNKA